tara:strand:+ start:2035 stop:2289 length:255 start_codon:yes stop_codon:yes gene_type:complete
MKYVKEEMMNKLLEDLKKQINKAKEDLDIAEKENAKLKDEVDSVWGILDEFAKSEVDNYSHLLKKMEEDVIVKELMEKGKKIDC